MTRRDTGWPLSNGQLSGSTTRTPRPAQATEQKRLQRDDESQLRAALVVASNSSGEARNGLIKRN